MKKARSYDLEKVRDEIENWRAQRKGRERIPKQIWKAAIALLQTYSFSRINRVLKLNARQFRKQCDAVGAVIPKRRNVQTPFIELPTLQLSTPIPLLQSAELPEMSAPASICRISIERADGSRINLSLPLDWLKIQTLVASLLRL